MKDFKELLRILGFEKMREDYDKDERGALLAMLFCLVVAVVVGSLCE